LSKKIIKILTYWWCYLTSQRKMPCIIHADKQALSPGLCRECCFISAKHVTLTGFPFHLLKENTVLIWRFWYMHARGMWKIARHMIIILIRLISTIKVWRNYTCIKLNHTMSLMLFYYTILENIFIDIIIFDWIYKYRARNLI
jgi:hypothetical protein